MKHQTKAGTTAQKQRAIQRGQDAEDAKARQFADDTRKSASAEKKNQASQTGTRQRPVKFKTDRLPKPGSEKALEPAPQFEAPGYVGSGKLQDMVALVTGGDSGIGRAVAVLYAREGADVSVVYLNEHADAEETRRCVEAEGRRCLLIDGDVKDSGFCQDAVERTVGELGGLDILVNNAAFQQHAESIEELTDERFDKTLRTNVYGYFYMARAAVPRLRHGGSIINTGSVVGLQGSARLLDYSTTKGAIHAFTKSLASNLLERGLRVNAVAPGPVWTPLNPADGPAEKIQEFGQHSDMGRAAQPEELAPAYVFLAAPSCASYITGIVLPVTGSVGAI